VRLQVTVRVLTVDTDKKQIGLTMKTEAESAAEKTGKRGGRVSE
jgi:ribosomal protein S1